MDQSEHNTQSAEMKLNKSNKRFINNHSILTTNCNIRTTFITSSFFMLNNGLKFLLPLLFLHLITPCHGKYHYFFILFIVYLHKNKLYSSFTVKIHRITCNYFLYWNFYCGIINFCQLVSYRVNLYIEIVFFFC